MDYLDDLYTVGPQKPLGYLPVSTITELCGSHPEKIREWASSQGLRSRTLSPFECNIGSGAVYVWDDEALQRLLDANADILARGAWPAFAEDFVIYVANKHAPQPELFELVGMAFNNPLMKEPKFARPPALMTTRG